MNQVVLAGTTVQQRRSLCKNCGHPMLCHIKYPLTAQDLSSLNGARTIPCEGGDGKNCGCIEWEFK